MIATSPIDRVLSGRWESNPLTDGSRPPVLKTLVTSRNKKTQLVFTNWVYTNSFMLKHLTYCKYTVSHLSRILILRLWVNLCDIYVNCFHYFYILKYFSLFLIFLNFILQRYVFVSVLPNYFEFFSNYFSLSIK